MLSPSLLVFCEHNAFVHALRLCLGAWSDHGERTGGFYACNRYETAKQEGVVCQCSLQLYFDDRGFFSCIVSVRALLIDCYHIIIIYSMMRQRDEERWPRTL